MKANAGAENTFDLENTYDYDGNIKTLMRHGSNNNLLDDFYYEYITGTNKLRKVSGPIDQFTYDYNGNMKGDELQHNYGLKYDHRNLLIEFGRVISENETELTRYYYDEAGNRIRKLILRNWSGGGGVPDPPDWGDIENLPIYEPEGEGGEGWSIYKNEFYVRGVGGNTIAEYNWETHQQWNVYGTDNVGKITKEEEEEFKFYYLKDHLGSIRAVIDEDNAVVSAQDYDMWGYLLENRTFNIDEEKYKFTGKERDNESSYDYFGARYYMSRIGRWGSVEPLMDKYPGTSPYVYSLNNPLIIIDKGGDDPYRDQLGSINDVIEEARSFIGKSMYEYLLQLPSSKSRYIYTKKGGFIDLLHFGSGAWATGWYSIQTLDRYKAAKIAMDLGEVIELMQEWSLLVIPESEWAQSAWDPEDPYSNLLGAVFGMYLNLMEISFVTEYFVKSLEEFLMLLEPVDKNSPLLNKIYIPLTQTKKHKRLPSKKQTYKPYHGETRNALPAIRTNLIKRMMELDRLGEY